MPHMALVLCGALSFWREKMCMISQMVNEKALEQSVFPAG